MQVDPIKPTVKAPGTKRLKLEHENPLSNAASKFSLRRYNLVPRAGTPATMVPYVTYQFPGLPSHDSTYGRGADPDFNDSHEFPAGAYTRPLFSST